MINSPEENEKALAKLSDLIEDYDANKSEIDILWVEIEEYEENAPEFAEFNKRINEIED
jgi:HTH-type transcriptional regulator/antitoxin HigA